MKIKKTTSIPVLLFATLPLLPTTNAAASFLYHVVNYSDADFAVSGTIETDGSIGDFATPPFGFQNWSVTWSDPTNSVPDVLFDETNSTWSVNSGIPANFVSVDATSISLLAPAGGQAAAAAHELTLTKGSFKLQWAIPLTDFSPLFLVQILDEANFLFERAFVTSYSNDFQVIAEAEAAVPEPATLALFGLGFAGMRAARRKR